MKYTIKFTSTFKKHFRLIQKRGYNISLLNEVIIKIANGEVLDKKYHDHELSGEFKGFRECHIKADWLLIYLIDDNVLVLTLIDIGTHSDLLDM